MIYGLRSKLVCLFELKVTSFWNLSISRKLQAHNVLKYRPQVNDLDKVCLVGQTGDFDWTELVRFSREIKILLFFENDVIFLKIVLLESFLILVQKMRPWGVDSLKLFKLYLVI